MSWRSGTWCSYSSTGERPSYLPGLFPPVQELRTPWFLSPEPPLQKRLVTGLWGQAGSAFSVPLWEFSRE